MRPHILSRLYTCAHRVLIVCLYPCTDPHKNFFGGPLLSYEATFHEVLNFIKNKAYTEELFHFL